MSYEGYEVWLCTTGHRVVYDAYDSPDDRDGWRCPHCGSGVDKYWSVDETNGEGVGYRKLEMVNPPRCRHCGEKADIEPATWRLKGSAE